MRPEGYSFVQTKFDPVQADVKQTPVATVRTMDQRQLPARNTQAPRQTIHK